MDSEADPYNVCGIACLAAKRLGFVTQVRSYLGVYVIIFISPQGDQISGNASQDKKKALESACIQLNQFFQFNGQ